MSRRFKNKNKNIPLKHFLHPLLSFTFHSPSRSAAYHTFSAFFRLVWRKCLKIVHENKSSKVFPVDDFLLFRAFFSLKIISAWEISLLFLSITTTVAEKIIFDLLHLIYEHRAKYIWSVLMPNDTNSCVHFLRDHRTQTLSSILSLLTLLRVLRRVKSRHIFSDNCLSRNSGNHLELFKPHRHTMIYMYTWRFLNAIQLKLGICELKIFQRWSQLQR